MIAATRFPCDACGHLNPHDEPVCAACGMLQRRRGGVPRAQGATVHVETSARGPVAATLRPLLAGAVLAPALAALPILSYVGWFVAALCHETGHAAVAWAAGCPAVPVISLAGHAMATHGAQSRALRVLLWALLAGLAWRRRDERLGVLVLAPLALAYPLFAFTSLREILFLLAGHAGELAFGGIFLWRAVTWRSTAERVASAAVAWFLLGKNVWLAGGLLVSDRVRAWYGGSGSFGLENDYVRLARDVLRVDLAVVAVLMLLATLAVPPLAWRFARGRR